MRREAFTTAVEPKLVFFARWHACADLVKVVWRLEVDWRWSTKGRSVQS